MSQDRQVFTDPSGKRRKWMVGGFAFALLLFSVFLALFAMTFAVQTLATQPHQAKLVTNLIPPNPTYREPVSKRLKQVAKLDALRGRANSPKTNRQRISLGFYVPWEQASIDSLRVNASQLTHVAPAWFSLKPDGTLRTTDFDLDSNPTNNEVIQIARNKGLKIVPIISNSINDSFSASAFDRVVLSRTNATMLIGKLIDICRQNGFDGINFDFENISPAAVKAYPTFVAQMAKRFHDAGLELSVDVQVGCEPSMLKAVGQVCDFVVLMAYDEHEETGDPGPIASLGWTLAALQSALEVLPPEKIVLGIGSYAYDWPESKSGGESISFQEAMLTAKGYRDDEKSVDVLKFDSGSRNAFFGYENDHGVKRIIWLLDAASAYNQFLIAKKNNLAGTALWSLGNEDPGVWSFWGASTPDPFAMQISEYGFEVDFEGKGEFLSLLSEPTKGQRRITLDPQSGFIANQVYESYASPMVLQKKGFKKGKITLTFDDGPDPAYTPAILDILKEKKAPAAFFCIGQNVESTPELTKRIYAEGHEIGNHSFTHPNLGAVSNERSELEITATQRVIEATLNVSTKLFRPPYNADSQPETQSQVRPVVLASKLGLITVGENVDPNDWNPVIADRSGETRPRTADDIVRLVMEDLKQRKASGDEGNIVLLHDAGGNREATVKALPVLIEQLRAQGYEIVPLGNLIGKTRAEMMPNVPASKRWSLWIDKIGFNVGHFASVGLTYCFIAAIILGASRTLIILGLAISYRRKPKVIPDPSFRPGVSVLIAAYNEEQTIVSTVKSVLESTYPIAEIIVIDDGSKDKTGAIASAEFSANPTVKVVTKENGGKASALNIGIEHATGQLLFCIDADTELAPDAIEKLVPYFQNPKIGAVAGSVEVGNVHNLLTLWQAIEYRTSQNMDRRAYAKLDAITVIPGAIGMWRKSAVIEVGGYESTTLAEDMDLTWKIRRSGYSMETEAGAKAYTEAPDRWGPLYKQRTRWAFGTLQCLWKHRSAIGRHGWFGCVVLPLQWVFQVVFQILGPLVDLQIVVSTIALILSLTQKSEEMSSTQPWTQLWVLLGMYALFFALELGAALWACWAEGRRPNDLGWLFLQRFAYRQLMYVVILKSIWRAFAGTRQSWGNLVRTGKAIGSSNR